MAEHGFKTGGLVKLKSGGPIMTIESHISSVFNDCSQLKCSWFDSWNMSHSKTFATKCLESADDENSESLISISKGATK